MNDNDTRRMIRIKTYGYKGRTMGGLSTQVSEILCLGGWNEGRVRQQTNTQRIDHYQVARESATAHGPKTYIYPFHSFLGHTTAHI